MPDDLKEHLINLDANPFIPVGWRVEEHRKGGRFRWNPKRIKMFLSKKRKDGKIILGSGIVKEITSQSVLNANLLDYLLKHPELIPEKWKGTFSSGERSIATQVAPAVFVASAGASAGGARMSAGLGTVGLLATRPCCSQVDT